MSIRDGEYLKAISYEWRWKVNTHRTWIYRCHRATLPVLPGAQIMSNFLFLIPCVASNRATTIIFCFIYFIRLTDLQQNWFLSQLKIGIIYCAQHIITYYPQRKINNLRAYVALITLNERFISRQNLFSINLREITWTYEANDTRAPEHEEVEESLTSFFDRWCVEKALREIRLSDVLHRPCWCNSFISVGPFCFTSCAFPEISSTKESGLQYLGQQNSRFTHIVCA